MSSRSVPLPVAPSIVLAAPSCCLGAYLNTEGGITEIRFLPPDTPLLSAQHAAAQRFAEAWQSYLDDPYAPHPALPLDHRSGSEFQRRVWAAISSIPCGRTQTYGEMAAQIGSHARAVGQACGANPFPIFVPCHRVIGLRGAGGFAHARDGWLLATKRWLLMHEGAL